MIGPKTYHEKEYNTPDGKAPGTQKIDNLVSVLKNGKVEAISRHIEFGDTFDFGRIIFLSALLAKAEIQHVILFMRGVIESPRAEKLRKKYGFKDWGKPGIPEDEPDKNAPLIFVGIGESTVKVGDTERKEPVFYPLIFLPVSDVIIDVHFFTLSVKEAEVNLPRIFLGSKMTYMDYFSPAAPRQLIVNPAIVKAWGSKFNINDYPLAWKSFIPWVEKDSEISLPTYNIKKPDSPTDTKTTPKEGEKDVKSEENLNKPTP